MIQSGDKVRFCTFWPITSEKFAFYEFVQLNLFLHLCHFLHFLWTIVDSKTLHCMLFKFMVKTSQFTSKCKIDK